jgi:uncharacterized membrane protein
MTTATPSKKDRRDQARRERLEREQAQAAAAARRRRFTRLGAVLAVAAVVVVVLVAVSSSGGGGGKTAASSSAASSSASLAGVRASSDLLAGIPQDGISLGSAKAPVRVLEFADLQCPFCRQATLDVLPNVIRDYVRPGKVRMEFHALAFIGPDSVRAARVAEAAGQQDKLWNVTELAYHNQGKENSGWATAEAHHGRRSGPRHQPGLRRAQRCEGHERAHRREHPRQREQGQRDADVPRRPGQRPRGGRRLGADRRHQGRAGRMSDRLRLAAIVISAVGIAIAGYLTYVHYAGISPVCEIAHGCEKVQTSEWSKVAGVPVAVLGLIGYVGILAALFVPGEAAATAAAGMALVGAGFSAYLTYREVFTIDAICIWCVASAILMTLLAILTVVRLARQSPAALSAARAAQ